MSKLAAFREAERKLQEQIQLLERLKSDSHLKKELEFRDALEGLMKTYDMSLLNIIEILDPGYHHRVTPQAGKPRAQRAVKIYRNPNTGEVVETKGGNHKLLKEWKQEHGADVVETWRTQ
ncbi:TPA: histone-like nucleoid-structuring protein, MvaT/MvaU family [Pseudomonas aeruginosa]|uniref:histone-like nucleoid-structuring protein, MvaT/MvaU family n=1 Tax=Pseudomonas aeruginosa TaxID=287 RepID=UPI000D34E83E|nr:histone-like nucleoid-structuring protein, MvaT/MvaU family [Pseudomonas aeruginosa]EKX0430402.1 DNA binding protein [Pseudomonas aeruginosa]EMB2824076.1 DNA binding protein [Pseudomonas aeruginosa]MCV0038294.1 DNA binding protein [Pseudomonas aeruginosa]MDS9770426.1 histone-like nucleoid-structuring protein, MvaT/MvaU family [Pseudomonas aeruginosa]PTZ30047.1 transcriptional regulator [Pseudomonas aeruginosa]